MDEIKILPIASGSTGNSMLIDLNGIRILIDLGVAASVIQDALSENDYCWENIDAVLITHAHSDHVRGLEACRRHINSPIFMSHTSRDTLMLEYATALTYSDKTEILPGLWVTAIRSPHDCPGTVGFKIETADTIVGYITDLGTIPESIMEALFGADCIVIESNYDDAMLRYGRYPAFLKRRILSDRGHLSNDACAMALARFADRGTKHFFLAHLSQENNRPELALDCAEKACAGMDVQIIVLPVLGKQLITVRD